jgi:hypothetical protein
VSYGRTYIHSLLGPRLSPRRMRRYVRSTETPEPRGAERRETDPERFLPRGAAAAAQPADNAALVTHALTLERWIDSGIARVRHGV